MPKVAKWALLSGIAGAIAIAAIGCNDVRNPVLTVPRDAARVRGPLPHGITYTVGSLGNNMQPDYGGLPFASTGASLLPGTVARITAVGDLTLHDNANCDTIFRSDVTSPIPPPGVVQNNGKVWVDLATDLSFPTSWMVAGSGYVTYFGTSVFDSLPIEIDAKRQGITGNCFVRASNPPVPTYNYTIEGATTLTIDILGVDVTASRTTVQAGQSVHFSATPINFPANGTVTWQFDTLGVTLIDIPSCANLLTCDYSPSRTGTMVACMPDENNMSICGRSPQINFIKCPTGDSLLDNPVLRAGLLKALADSWADSLPTSRRREVGGYAFFDSTGLHVVRTENPATNTPCKLDYSATQNAVLIFHVHPFNPPEGFTLADILPSDTTCAPVGTTRRYDPKIWGGPSDTDWAASIATHHPSYIIDKKRVYVTNPNITDSTMWADSTKKYDWNTRKCRW